MTYSALVYLNNFHKCKQNKHLLILFQNFKYISFGLMDKEKKKPASKTNKDTLQIVNVYDQLSVINYLHHQ